MKKMHLIRQHDEKDCGAACLSMILEYYGLKLPMAVIRDAIQVDQNGANIYGMLEGASRFGLKGDARGGSAEDVWEVLSGYDFSDPVIIRVLNRGVYEHYVVVSDFKGNKLQICDPDMGKRTMTREEFQECFLGNIIFYNKTETFRAENRKKGELKRFINMLLKQKKLLSIITVLSFFVTLIGICGTFVFQYLIDSVLPEFDRDGTAGKGLESFVALLLILGGLYVIKMAVELLRGKLLMLMSKNIDLPLMLGYYDHVVNLPMRFFETRKTGEILSRFVDAEKIRDAISGATLTILIDTVLVAVCGTVLYRSSMTLFIIAIATFILYVLISIAYIKPLEKNNSRSMEQGAEFNSYLKESIDGMETVKTSQAEDTVKEKTAGLFKENLKTNISGSMLSLSKESLIDFVTSISGLVLLGVGALKIANGEMSIGSLMTFSSLLTYFLSPVQNLVDLQGNLQTALIAAERLNDVLDLKSEDMSGAEPEEEMMDIRFEDVFFRYGTRALTLNGLDFSVKKGQKIALVGESGCGKSTTAKLIQGLYTPETGRVLINGIPTSELSLTWMRKRIAFVTQNTFLFSDTVRNNLTIGLEEHEIPDEDEFIRILKACACDFVFQMPMGLDTFLEENGNNLSGGQRQRLAIARALLRKPQLLILDEATSALDTITEAKVQKAFCELYPFMTIVMIAHRLSTVKQCDQILVMEHGTVVERGTHSDLLKGKKGYADLWLQQNNAVAA